MRKSFTFMVISGLMVLLGLIACSSGCSSSSPEGRNTSAPATTSNSNTTNANPSANGAAPDSNARGGGSAASANGPDSRQPSPAIKPPQKAK